MNTWPYALLPDPLIEYDIDQRVAVARTAMDSGRVRQRKRFSTDHRMVGVSWSLTDLQYTVFQSFHRYKLSLGADFFFADLWFGDGAQQVKARFAGGAVSARYRGDRWMVTGALEVEEVPVMIEDSYDALAALGFDVDAYEQSVADLTEITQL